MVGQETIIPGKLRKEVGSGWAIDRPHPRIQIVLMFTDKPDEDEINHASTII